MKRWMVLDSRGNIIVDFEDYEKREADQWMSEHKEEIENEKSFLHGAVLTLRDVQAEVEQLRAYIDKSHRRMWIAIGVGGIMFIWGVACWLALYACNSRCGG